MGQEIRFYVDEHVPGAVVRGLRQRGVDVLTTSEANMLGATDEEQLQRALAEVRIFVTHDSDFLRLHTTGVTHSGIVYVPHQVSIGEMIRGLMLVYEILEEEDMRGHVEYL